ncbi:MAG: YidC/Oxa1 family membrane protein insertase [Microgenomates group bacterium]
MRELWYLFLFQPILNALIFLYQVLFNNLGLAIIALTIIIRSLLIPLTLPSLKAVQKMKELAPELEKLKEKYKNDRQQFAKAQLELYRQKGINPAAGCLPQIIQLIILIALYQAFAKVLVQDGDIIEKINQVLYPFLRLSSETVINTRFLYLDLAKPDVFYLPDLKLPLPGFLLLSAALIQFVSSKIMQPTVKKASEEAKETSGIEDDLTVAMQKQMLYLFPLMTIFIGYSFPSGLVLYWFVFSLFTLIQQILMIKLSEKRNEFRRK